jgi:hypothetical protein
MNQIKMYFKIAIISVIIGLAARLAWFAFNGWNGLTLPSIIEYICFGLIFGLVTTFSLTYIVKRVSKAAPIYIANIIVEIVLMIVLFIYQSTKVNQFQFIYRWMWILTLTVVLSTLTTAYWYRNVMLYNKMLEIKKEKLKRENH